MGLLKNVTGQWRLFWVLEGIGLSFVLALLAIFATGNSETLHSIYSDVESPSFPSVVLYTLPITITVVALLATGLASNPTPSATGSVFRASYLVWVFRFLVLGWIVTGFFFYYTGFFYSYYTFDFYLGLISLDFIIGVTAIVSTVRYRQALSNQLAEGFQRFRNLRNPSIRNCRNYLLWSGVLLWLVQWVWYSWVDEYHENLAPHSLFSLWWLAADLWLTFGMYSAVTRSTEFLSLPASIGWMLLAWGFEQGGYTLSRIYTHDILVSFVVDTNQWVSAIWSLAHSVTNVGSVGWLLLVGTFLWGETPGTYGVGFWAAAISVKHTVTIGILISSVFVTKAGYLF